MRLTKDRMSKMLAKADVQPEHSEHFKDYNIFIGEGFADQRTLHWYGKFGIEPKDFPSGAIVTWWLIARDEKIVTGFPIPHAPTHDIIYDHNTRKRARIGAAILIARQHIDRLRANASSGVILNG